MDKAKENWIEHYIFVSGPQWGDPPPTREEAERAWAERHEPKPVIEPIPPGPYVEPRFDPKPATPEPPELPPLGETFLLDGRPYVVTGVVQSAPSTPEEIIDRVTDAISDFTARRKAKREPQGWHDMADDGHEWHYYGDFCAKCKMTMQEANEIGPAGPWPRCEDVKTEKERNATIARAMSTPLPHDPPMSARLMPWRGKE